MFLLDLPHFFDDTLNCILDVDIVMKGILVEVHLGANS